MKDSVCRRAVAGWCRWGLFLGGIWAVEAHAETTVATSQYVVSNWQIADGLPSDRIRHISQSRTGYLWLATADGLARFDGVRFRTFNIRNTPELPDNLINRLFEDRSGRLWLGHSTGHITRLDASGWHRFTLSSDWLGVPVERFAQAADGTVWALNREGWIYALMDDGPGALFRDPVASQIVDIVSDTEGHVWRADRSSVEEWKQGASSESMQAGPDEQLTYPRIAASRKGGVWVFEGRLARRWHRGAWREKREFALESSRARVFWETRDGKLLRGTFDSGLEISFPGAEVLQVAGSAGLPSDWIRCIWEDTEGSLWLGVGSRGLSRLRPRYVEMVAPPEPWEDRSVLTVSPATEGVVWFGIEGPGIYHFDEIAGSRQFASDDEDRLVAHAVLEDKTGQVWVGASGSSATVWRNGELESVVPGQSLARTNALWQTQDGDVWLGTYAGPARWREGVLDWPVRQAGVELADVRCFGEDQQGGVWVGTMGSGVVRYHAGEVQEWRESNGLSSDRVWSLWVENSSTVWVGSYGKGLSRIQDGEIRLVSTVHGLPSDVICAIQPDGTGAIWFSSDTGIFKVMLEDLHACADGATGAFSSLVLDQSDGLSTTAMTGGGHPVAGRAANGELWFTSAGGLARLDPRRMRSAHAAPSVGIEDLRIDGSGALQVRLVPVANDRDLLTVPAGAGSLEIDYTAFSFVSPERIQFRYRMEGLDEAWVKAGNRRTAFYNNVPPGNYRFLVSASYDGSNWSAKSADVAIRFEPYWWQTMWFRAGASIVFALGAGGLVSIVMQQRHRREVAGLRHAQAIERERTRIAHDIHDDLGAGLTQINLLTSAAKRGAADLNVLRNKIDQIEASAQDMTRAMDEIVWAVSPGNDTLDSLATYLGLYARDYLQSAHVKCDLNLPIELPDWWVSAEVRHGIYLCVKEALNNVLKHAGATRVRFSVCPENDRIVFELADDGGGLSGPNRKQETGANRGRIANGVGFKGMQRRMSELGGAMAWDEPEKGGAVIRFILPKNCTKRNDTNNL